MNASAAASPVDKDQATDPAGRGLVKPSSRLILLGAAWLLLASIANWLSALDWLMTPWFWFGGVLALVAIHDLWSLWREQPRFTMEREMPGNWPVNSPVRLALNIRSQSRRTLQVSLHELYPGEIRAEHMPQSLQLQPGEQARLRWRATAQARGLMTLPGCHLAWLSPLGLWWRRQTVEHRDQVRVYPNFNLVVQYGMLAGDRRLDQMGIHLARRRGIGSDFNQLRDYRDGDSLRQIDWHATARMRKLIAKDYQEERDQRVVFLLDCSRRMRAMDGQLSHFDQCLNAMLLLGHVALKQGDDIALHTMAAGDGAERLLPPGRGQRQFGALLETVFDLQAGTGYPDYLNAAATLMKNQRRRSLVILLTNLRDEDHTELDPAVKLMRQRHLVILADLRENLEPDTSRRSTALDRALLSAGSAMYRERRKAATRHLRHHGIIHLDLTPAELPGALVSQYRKLKASGIF